MSPEKARVYIINDDPEWRGIEREIAERHSHQVVGESGNLKDALDQVESFEGIGVEVVILDGNLAENTSEGKDGQRILQEIRDKAPNVKTVGFSTQPIMGVDKDVGKSSPSKDLGEAITKI